MSQNVRTTTTAERKIAALLAAAKGGGRLAYLPLSVLVCRLSIQLPSTRTCTSICMLTILERIITQKLSNRVALSTNKCL